MYFTGFQGKNVRILTYGDQSGDVIDPLVRGSEKLSPVRLSTTTRR
jgi:hypothetical protein